MGHEENVEPVVHREVDVVFRHHIAHLDQLHRAADCV